MTSPGAEQSTSERKKETTPLGRSQLEYALHRALNGGAKTIPQQIRYILALSQLTGAKSANAPQPAPPIPTTAARLMTIVQMAGSLKPSARARLLKEIRVLENARTRARLLLALAPHLRVDSLTDVIRELYRDVRSVNDPALTSEILCGLAPLLPRPGSLTASESPLARVVNNARKMTGLEARARSLGALAVHLPPERGVALFDRVLDEIDSVDNDSLHASIIISIATHLPAEIIERVLQNISTIFSPAERARALTVLARNAPAETEGRVHTEALRAIAQIRNEDERADALAAFAPYLQPASEDRDFPDLLEQALAIAIGLTRRHQRARALVALAPHLTMDLQGEALAAVHNLASERDRALLLADLAPTLPPNMLVASMAVAHTMREQDSRVHALTVLARYAPKQARSQILLDALAAATNLPHHFERVTALMNLVDILPEQLQDQAFTSALETTRLIENENARARALSLLGGYLPPRLLKRALEAAYQIEDLQQRLSALVGIIPRVTEDQRAEVQNQMLETTRQLTFDYKRARAIASIAPHLTPAQIKDALLMADNLDDAYDRVTAYIALAQNLPPDERVSIIEQARAALDHIEDGYDRSSALAAVAPFAGEGEGPGLARSAAEVIGDIPDEYDRASAITILAPLLAANGQDSDNPLPEMGTAVRAAFTAALEINTQHERTKRLHQFSEIVDLLDESTRYALWREGARRLASLPLPDTLLCLGALLPLVMAISSEDQLEEIAYILGVR